MRLLITLLLLSALAAANIWKAINDWPSKTTIVNLGAAIFCAFVALYGILVESAHD